MSKRILTWDGHSETSRSETPLSENTIRVYKANCKPNVLYAVIIPNDAIFEGL